MKQCLLLQQQQQQCLPENWTSKVKCGLRLTWVQLESLANCFAKQHISQSKQTSISPFFGRGASLLWQILSWWAPLTCTGEFKLRATVNYATKIERNYAPSPHSWLLLFPEGLRLILADLCISCKPFFDSWWALSNFLCVSYAFFVGYGNVS